jgi:hypothetical protein
MTAEIGSGYERRTPHSKEQKSLTNLRRAGFAVAAEIEVKMILVARIRLRPEHGGKPPAGVAMCLPQHTPLWR